MHNSHSCATPSKQTSRIRCGMRIRMHRFLPILAGARRSLSVCLFAYRFRQIPTGLRRSLSFFVLLLPVSTDSQRLSPVSLIFVLLLTGFDRFSPVFADFGRFPKFHRVFSGRDPGTLKSDIVSTKTSTINLFGFETQIENSMIENMETDRSLLAPGLFAPVCWVPRIRVVYDVI